MTIGMALTNDTMCGYEVACSCALPPPTRQLIFLLDAAGVFRNKLQRAEVE